MVVAVLAMLAACRFDTNGVALSDGGGGDDVDASPGADAAPPDAASCSGTQRMCLDATRFSGCIGGLRHDETCALGCLTAPEAHCAEPLISNGLDPAWLDGATLDLEVKEAELLVFDTH